MQQILESVNYCHQHGIVHRDLKVSGLVYNLLKISLTNVLNVNYLQSLSLIPGTVCIFGDILENTSPEL